MRTSGPALTSCRPRSRQRPVIPLEREGVEGPGDIAIVGSEAAVEEQLRHLSELGATDLLATIFPVDGSQTSVTRTRALLQGLVGRV